MKITKSVFILAIASLLLSSCGPKRYTGLVRDPEAEKNAPLKARLATRDYENLPEKVDLSIYAPTPGDQGSYGTCVAWATCYGAMTMTDSIAYDITNQSKIDEKVFSPYYMFKSCNPETIRGDRGMSIEKALEFITYSGIPYRNDFEKRNVNNFEAVDISMYDHDELYRIEDYSVLFFSYDNEPLGSYWNTNITPETKTARIKKSLSQKRPVIISFRDYSSFSNIWWWNDTWTPSPFQTKRGNHAMVVVGYDDSKNNGSFLIQNSWGTSWGKNGRIWIRYNDLIDYLNAAYEINRGIVHFNFEEPEPIVEPDPYFSPEPFEQPEPYVEPEPFKNPEPYVEPEPFKNPEPYVEPEPFKNPEPYVEPKPYVTPNPEPKPHVEPEPIKKLLYKGEIYLPIFNSEKNIQFKIENGILKSVNSFSSSTRFQYVLTVKNPCYMYAFASDETTFDTSTIFPEGNVSPLLDYTSNTIVYPAEDTFITLDDVTGTDYLVVIFSTERLDLNDITQKWKNACNNGLNGEKNYSKRIEQIFGKENIVNPAYTKKANGEISFEVWTSSSKKIMPVLIQISHVD